MKQVTKAELQQQVNKLTANNILLVNAVRVLQVLAFAPELTPLSQDEYNEAKAEAYKYNPFLSKSKSA